MGKVRKTPLSRYTCHAVFFILFVWVLMNSVVGIAQEKILILRNVGQGFEEAVKGISDDIDDEFTIIDRIVERNNSVDDISEIINDIDPVLVVLMDNHSINLYRKFQQRQPDSTKAIPSVSLMAVLLDKVLKGVKNGTGIRYEIPVVTGVVNLRSISKSPIKKIGIIYRELMEEAFKENYKFCAREGIELVGVLLPNQRKNKAKEISQALKKLLKKDKVDAMWVLNDNILLDAKLMKNAWIPATQKYKIPMMVGVEVLVNPRLNFGTFAILPDHYAFGVQAAEMILDIIDDDYEVVNRPIEPPLSVFKVLNLKQAKKVLKISKEHLNEIDKIIN